MKTCSACKTPLIAEERSGHQQLLCPKCDRTAAVESFDPYYTWLGIPPAEQPPHFYRLLGVPLFESNASVIENAADRQMQYLRSLQAGARAAESQRLLNEVAQARTCLLDEQARGRYDARLKGGPGSGQVAKRPVTSANRSLPRAAAVETGASAAQTPGTMPQAATARPKAALIVAEAVRPMVATAISALPAAGATPRRPRLINQRVALGAFIGVGGVMGVTLGVLLIYYLTGEDFVGMSGKLRAEAALPVPPEVDDSPFEIMKSRGEELSATDPENPFEVVSPSDSALTSTETATIKSRRPQEEESPASESPESVIIDTGPSPAEVRRSRQRSPTGDNAIAMTPSAPPQMGQMPGMPQGAVAPQAIAGMPPGYMGPPPWMMGPPGFRGMPPGFVVPPGATMPPQMAMTPQGIVQPPVSSQPQITVQASPPPKSRTTKVAKPVEVKWLPLPAQGTATPTVWQGLDFVDPNEVTLEVRDELTSLPAQAHFSLSYLKSTSTTWNVRNIVYKAAGVGESQGVPAATIRLVDGQVLFGWATNFADPVVQNQIANCVLEWQSAGAPRTNFQLREPIRLSPLTLDLNVDRQTEEIDVPLCPAVNRLQLKVHELSRFPSRASLRQAAGVPVGKPAVIEFQDMPGAQIELRLMRRSDTGKLVVRVEPVFQETASREFELTLPQLEKSSVVWQKTLAESKAKLDAARKTLDAAKSSLRSLQSNRPSNIQQLGPWQQSVARAQAAGDTAAKHLNRLEVQIQQSQARLDAVPKVRQLIQSLHQTAIIKYAVCACADDREVVLVDARN